MKDKAIPGIAGFFLILFSFFFMLPLLCFSQQTGPSRKLVGRTTPEYPQLARSMALQGIVKVDALVAPDGTVKSVEIRGGHPVLAQAALKTVRLWKWEPAARESHELVEVRFTPE